VTSIVFKDADHNDIDNHAQYWPSMRDFLAKNAILEGKK
jgi:hypothetical protein